MIIIDNKDAIRRIMRTVCRGEENCDICPIKRECNKFLGKKTPHDADFNNVKDLFINMIKMDGVKEIAHEN